MKVFCPDCQTIRNLTNEERMNIDNEDFETYCHQCGAAWKLSEMLR